MMQQQNHLGNQDQKIRLKIKSNFNFKSIRILQLNHKIKFINQFNNYKTKFKSKIKTADAYNPWIKKF